MIKTIRYWQVLGSNYGYCRQAVHLWRRFRDPDHDRIQCVCCCVDCDLEEE